MKSKKVLLVAGEVSGDLHGAHLVEAIHRIDPDIRFYGIGGQELEKAGLSVLYPSTSLSVVGITEVFWKLRSILQALRGLKKWLGSERPDLVLLIDFPDFNLRLAKSASRRKIPVAYYISPQVWAWRPGRVEVIARCVKKMVVFFPFELSLYRAAGVDVECVGHPLVDLVRPTLSKEEAREKFGLDAGRVTVGLLPGSRPHEVSRLLPDLLESARLIEREIPSIQFILPLAPGISRESVPHEHRLSSPFKVIEGATYDAMNVSDLLIMASGTATLEAAILKKPMVIVYKVSRLSYWIGRALIRVDHIGLVNLVAEKEIAPELIQDQVTPRRITREALRILRDPVLRKEMSESMNAVHERLGSPGAGERAARVIYDVLQRAAG